MTATHTAHVFIDTNTLIHFPTFDEVDWPKHLQAKEVHLLLAPIVLREIDKLKDDPRLKARVQVINGKLKKLLEPPADDGTARVRPGVILSALTVEPRIDWEAHELDRTEPDDRLLATMLVYRETHPDASLMLLSNDLGPCLKAATQGLPVLDPEEFLQRLDLTSQQEKELRQLKRDYQALLNRQADPKVGLSDGPELVEHLRLPRPAPECEWISDDEIDRTVEDASRSCLALLTPQLESVVPDECERYRTAVATYAERLDVHLRMVRARDAGWQIPLTFVLKNAGASPANNIEAVVFFPPDMTVLRNIQAIEWFEDPRLNSLPKPPKVPTLPTWEEQISRLATAGMYNPTIPASLLTGMLPPISPIPRPSEPETVAAHGTVTLRHPKLRAGDAWFSEAIRTVSPPLTSDGITMHYIIHADELPGQRGGTLHLSFS